MLTDFSELLEYDESCPVSIDIYIPSHVVEHEVNIFKTNPFCMLQLGNHRIYETRSPRTQEEKNFQYMGLFWLMINSKEDTLECRMNSDTICRFIIYKLALKLVAVKNATNAERGEVLIFDNPAYNDVVIHCDRQSNDISFKKLQVHTKEYGLLRAPTKEEMNKFFSWAKITNRPL
jgi:hypothetical protein